MAGLSDIQVIETLDDYGFTTRAPVPWRGEDPENWTRYPIEISALPDFARDGRRNDNAAAVFDDIAAAWSAVAEQIDRRASQPERLPPPGPVDALAWYLPFHYYGPDWGIYIKEAEVIRIAAHIKQRIDGPGPYRRETEQLCRVALSVLYLHEAFHHKIESFATRLEIARLSAVYLRYDEAVYRRLLGTDDLLEEAIACSEMHRRLSSEKSFHGGVDPAIKDAALMFLFEWIPSLPPGYCRGLDRETPQRIGELLSQVAHAAISPSQPASDWEIGNQMIRGLFNKNVIAHVVVPIGDTPVIPWLDSARYLPIEPRRVERHITRVFGYYDTGRGKGDHRHYHCKGRVPITLDFGAKSVAPHIQKQVKDALGYKDIRELAAKC